MSDPDLWAWKRNVIPEFQGLSTDQIKEKLKDRQQPFQVAFEALTRDFTISTGMRNANAFGASAIYYIGLKHLDRRGCCGVQNYSVITHIPSIDELLKVAGDYTLIGVDNIDGAVPIDDYIYPDRPMFVFGCEASGLSKEMIAACKEVIYIEQFGSVPSLNCGTASGIIMHDFVSKYRRRPR